MNFKSKSYIVLKEDKIIKVLDTAQGIDGVNRVLKKKNIEYDLIEEVPDWHNYRLNTNINEYENHHEKPLIDRILEGYADIPEGKEIVHGKLVSISIESLEGPNESCDTEDDDEDQYDTGTEDLIDEEIRQMAIENLRKKGKI